VADDTSDLIVRPMSGQDEATPNANGTMVSNLMALYLWTGEERYRQRAEAVLKAFAGAMRENVLAHAGLLAAELDVMAPTLIVFVVPEGGDARALRRALNDVSLPGAVVQEVRVGESLPASSPAHGKTAIDGKTTAYVCIGPQCSLPVTEPEKLIETIKGARRVVLT
jgi:uncharacterized protein YyaL (SSP411 family)